MNGNLGQLVMVTRAEETEGFPPLLAEMLWRGNFSRRPEYSVFARDLGRAWWTTLPPCSSQDALLKGSQKLTTFQFMELRLRWQSKKWRTRLWQFSAKK